MKVLIENSEKQTYELIDCSYVKFDEERILFVGDRTISLKIDRDITFRYVQTITQSFLSNISLNIVIRKDKIIISQRSDYEN